MIKTTLTALAALLIFSGCATYPSRTTQARQTENHLLQQEKQRRVNGRIEMLEGEIERISLELDRLRKTLDTRMTDIERKSQQDKREMIAKITSHLEKLMVTTSAPDPAPASGSSSGQGWEHVVQKGDTLSTIANAYNVTTKVLIDVNNLKNPDRLSIGQKLFIPE